MNMQTQQQQRAGYALDKVRAIIWELGESEQEGGALTENEQNATKATKKQKEFKGYASAFPPMILMNGLGQASAFYLSKGGTHKKLYRLLSDWLKLNGQPYSGQNLMDGITGNNMHRYRVAQAEALLLLDWVKKFANAYVPEG